MITKGGGVSSRKVGRVVFVVPGVLVVKAVVRHVPDRSGDGRRRGYSTSSTPSGTVTSLLPPFMDTRISPEGAANATS